jgi:hypothetical protein
MPYGHQKLPFFKIHNLHFLQNSNSSDPWTQLIELKIQKLNQNAKMANSSYNYDLDLFLGMEQIYRRENLTTHRFMCTIAAQKTQQRIKWLIVM